MDRRILNTVAELGARYRPHSTADQEDHQTCCLLLARDLADVDPGKLKDAANEWARTERWMPKGSDLREIISRKTPKDNRDGPENLKRLAAKYNAAEWMRSDLRWVVVGTELKLEPR